MIPERTSERLNSRRRVAGLTLAEVVVAMGISVIAVLAIVSGYLFSIVSAEKSSLSMAAGAKAVGRLEETRCAKWDTSSWPPVDQLVSSNFPNELVVLDLGGTGNAVTYATNTTQISQISMNPPLKKIHVECVFNFQGSQVITAAVETCRAPDQ